MKTNAPVHNPSVLSKLTAYSKASIVLFALALFTSAASAASWMNPATTVYVVSLGASSPGQFGTVNLANGSFHPIQPNEPVGLSSLVWWHGELLSLATSDPYLGYLVQIDPGTGSITPIGATGQGSNAFDLAEVFGKLYMTDFQNNLYSVNPHTGAATLINNATGMPPDPNIPFTTNPDGTFNLCDESFYGVGGTLYATFDSFNVDLTTAAINENPADHTVAPALYRIDPSTGKATLLGPTDLGIGATIELNGRFYALESPVTTVAGGFPSGPIELFELNLANGKTKFIRAIDSSVGPIFGAAPILPFF